MRENLMSGSMWQGMGNLDMVEATRHSQKKWRATGYLTYVPGTIP